MELIQLTPQLHFIQFPVGHVYLWHDPDGLTLIDAGLPGSAPLIAAAIQQAGYEPADLRHLVLTHFHPDHIGAAADIAGWGDVEVLAHHADAPFIRAQAAGPPPDLADWERPSMARSRARSPKNHRRRPGSTASSATATNSASATAPWQSPPRATRPAASRSTFHGTRCYSPATRLRGPRTEP